jgi:hypothetical protein
MEVYSCTVSLNKATVFLTSDKNDLSDKRQELQSNKAYELAKSTAVSQGLPANAGLSEPARLVPITKLGNTLDELYNKSDNKSLESDDYVVNDYRARFVFVALP